MRFIFTGTASGKPVAHRRHSSLLVEACGERVLIDAGEGVAVALQELKIETSDISRIIITHTHADHVSGLPMLLQAMHLSRRTQPLRLSVPPARAPWFRAWLDGMYMFHDRWSYDLRIDEYGVGADVAKTEADGRMNILSFRNSHLDKLRESAARYDVAADSYSLVIGCQGVSALVSSDIASIDDIASIEDIALRVEECDLLVIDAAHVTQEEIFSLAQKHKGLRSVCTHIPPELECELPALRARAEYETDGRILYAEDGMEFVLESGTAARGKTAGSTEAGRMTMSENKDL